MLNQVETSPLKLSADPARALRMLIIDDSELDRHRLIRLCNDAGLNFVATEVATIADMKSALEQTVFDLVFIDYLLAGEDGLQAVDLLAETGNSATMSIMIAGEGRVDIAVEAMRRGCADYVTKDNLKVDSLQKSIATALERRVFQASLEREQDIRKNLERNIRRYAASSSAEMRTLLAATLRRMRNMRSHMKSPKIASEWGELESGINQLWDALPAFNTGAEAVLQEAQQIEPLKIH